MRRSIIVRIISATVLISLVLLVVLSYLSIAAQRRLLTQAFIDNAQSTAYSLESCIGSRQDFENQARFFAVIQKSIWLDPDIVNISFNLLDGNNLVTKISSDVRKNNLLSTQVNLKGFSNVNKVVSQTIAAENGDILRVISPLYISGQIEGTVEIDFTLSDVEDKIKATTLELLYYYLPLLALFVLISYLSLRWNIIIPILDLSKGVKAIAEEDFNYRITNNHQDELGDLAASFNKLAGDLKASREKLENYNRELQKEVAKKTKELSKAKNDLENANVVLEKNIQERIIQLEKLRNKQEEIIKQRTEDLNNRMLELEKMNGYMVDRELKMVALKKENENLKKGLGQKV